MRAPGPSTLGALMCVVGLAVAGCGSSSSGGAGTSGSAPLDQPQLDAAANAICRAEAAANNAVSPPPVDHNTQQEAAYIDQLEPIMSANTTKLEALRPASDVATAWTAFMALRKRETSVMHAIRVGLDTANGANARKLPNITVLAALADAKATAVGASACAE